MLRFCILKKLIQREINKMDEAIWEMLKHTCIVEQCELKEQNEKQDFDKEVFYKPPTSPSKL
jgi:hypothetical protein